MKLDLVHDVQTAYRKVLDCVSKPGTINSLQPESEKLELPLACYKATLLLMLMFLDTEVSFHVLGHHHEKTARYISQLTYAKVAPLSDADFVFVLRERNPHDFTRAVSASRLGDLINPHRSATVVVEVETITPSKELALTGPGIQDENHVAIVTDTDFVPLRADKNVEYPLGIEMCFIDDSHNLLILPRTTTITRMR